MRDSILEKVTTDLLSLPPLIHRSTLRKLVRTRFLDKDIDITPHHYEIMHLLENNNNLCIGEIGSELQISKAQMTQLIDKLVELGMVERSADENDRRAVNIVLTPKAVVLKQQRVNEMIEATREAVSGLTEEELENLSSSLRTVRDILSKLQ
jgi:DNA-binding MarR family transcriptional regulator